MFGQFLELPWPGRPGMPGRGAFLALLEVLAGALVLVDVVGAVVLVVAALAMAAPPPATAALTASVVRIDLILWLNIVHLL